MRELRGKKALITGAASGIGRAIALRLAREGTDLFLLDINAQGLAEVVQQASQMGVEAIGYHCDIGSAEELTSASTAVLEHWGALNILVNNAGVCFHGASLDMTDEQLERLLAINVLAPARLVRAFVPTLLAHSEGHILNVSSMYGLFATNRCSAYHLSKFGLVGFSEALRAEYGCYGLGVTALCPGFVNTDLLKSMPNLASRKTPRPPPRWLCTTPERVAEKAVRAIRINQRLALVTPLAYVGYYLRRIAPGLLDSLFHIGWRKSWRPETQREATSFPDAPGQRLSLLPGSCHHAA